MTDQIIGYNRESTDIAIISGEREITFPELLQRIGLYSRKSPTKAGERTLIFSENREGWIYAFYSDQRLQSRVCMDFTREDGSDESGCQRNG